MSASEPAADTANLQATIEQLIAETVRRSQTDQDAEKVRLKAAMKVAATEIETAQSAMNRALNALHDALNEKTHDETVIEVPLVEAHHAATPDPEPEATTEPAAAAEPVEELGPHRLDLIAHDVTISVASGLQSLLRGRPEVKSAQTREFVNGELRLDLEMTSGLDMEAFTAWIEQHGGRIATQTPSVIELRFTSN